MGQPTYLPPIYLKSNISHMQRTHESTKRMVEEAPANPQMRSESRHFDRKHAVVLRSKDGPSTLTAHALQHGALQLDSHMGDGIPFAYRATESRWAIVCFVAKAGSTAWKAALVQGLAIQGFRMNLSRSPHKQLLPYSWPGPALPPHATLPRLMFVRHPVSRLLSAYLGKFKTRKIGIPGWSNVSNFRSFVRAVTTVELPMLDMHFRLQTDQCGLGLRQAIGYTYLRVEELGRWFRWAVCSLHLQDAMQASYWRSAWTAPCSSPPCCFVRTSDCGCKLDCASASCGSKLAPVGVAAAFGTFNNASEHLEKYYDHHLAQQVNTWAHRDLKAFHYTPWLPGRDIAHALKPMRKNSL